MQITRENIGDTLCLYQTGKHIRIFDVDPKYVCYETEDGYRYATSERFIDAFPVTDPSRIAVFNENYKLGKVLNHAEYKAFVDLLTPSEKEIFGANDVLGVIKAQQAHLDSRLAAERAKSVPGEALANLFLSQLSEMSCGSHDTLWGHKVQLINDWTYEFQIDGKIMDYASAKNHLSKVQFPAPEKKVSLSEAINAANLRKEKASSSDIVQEHSLAER